MTVTVITPVFNGSEHLAHNLVSVRNQTFADFEHIVVDDGSTDDSAEVVRQHAASDPRLTLVQQANQGLSAARNAGLRHARSQSEFVLFVDHDDVMRPEALQLLVDALRSAPRTLAAHGAVSAIDGEGAPMPLVRNEAATRKTVVRPERIWTRRSDVRLLDEAELSGFDSLAYVLYIYTPGQVLLRKDALRVLGGFDPNLRVAQDYDLWLRVSAQAPLVSVPDVVLDYRQTASSLSSDQATTRREDLYARFKAITDRDVPAGTRTLARHLHRQHEWHRAADRVDHLMTAIRDRDLRVAVRELLRCGRSATEAALAALPSVRVYAWRKRRFASR